jgi:phage/plasmid primase-like uncharacterized protein
MSAKDVAHLLGGHKQGRLWLCPCPVPTHGKGRGDRNPSLLVSDDRDGRVRFSCRAGCASRDVAEVIRDMDRGALQREGPRHDPAIEQADKAKKLGWAKQVWNRTVNARGTLVERYLASRRITIAPPPPIRFHSALRHRGSQMCWPTMVAGIQDASGQFRGIHRTYLRDDGGGKAPVDGAKMTLGDCSGNSVHLAPAAPTLMVGEGIETCLSAMQATGLPAWAALSAGNLTKLILPAEAGEVIILVDGDPTGRKYARLAARRWIREGRRVRIAQAPEGKDFNDLLEGVA